MILATEVELDAEVLAQAAHDLAEAGSLTFVVDHESVTYRASGERILIEAGVSDGDTLVEVTATAWTDLTGQVRSCINLQLAGELRFLRGGFEQLADWDPALRYLHASIPPYRPERANLQGRDPRAAHTLADSDEELRAQLETMGYLHLRGVFSSDEVATANAEVDRLADLARPGDEQSWWVDDENDRPTLCRLVYSTLRSPLLAAIEGDTRVTRLGTLLDPGLRVAPDRMEGTAVLLKVPGKTKGLSNIPWHQDCGMGGHAIFCPAVSVGIQLTGSSAETGNLKVVPGSHGQTMHVDWERRLTDVPVVEIDTQPGDVTVHIQDLMHASPRPTGSGGRRTMYVTHYPPQLWDHIGPRQAYNDLVRNRVEHIQGAWLP